MDRVEAENKEARSSPPLDCIVVTYEWLVGLQGGLEVYMYIHNGVQ
jgi:hypothetical protein